VSHTWTVLNNNQLQIAIAKSFGESRFLLAVLFHIQLEELIHAGRKKPIHIMSFPDDLLAIP
jgi:hypothetical protein